MKNFKNAIVIGASSGIGKALTNILVNQGYKTAITGRRESLLDEIGSLNKESVFPFCFDITKSNNLDFLERIKNKLGTIDLVIFSAGFGDLNNDLNYEIEKKTNALNVNSFTEIINWSYHVFQKQGFGHLVVISSIAGLRGGKASPAYNASKAYQINYLEGLSQRNKNKNIFITDIRPGFVDTAMAKGEGLFWVASKEKAAKQIYSAILKKKKVVYVTKRWRLIAFILKTLPKRIYIKHF